MSGSSRSHTLPVVCSMAFLLGACASTSQGEAEAGPGRATQEGPTASSQPSGSEQRSPQGATDALRRADSAFLSGDFGAAVVEANRVMEGAASPEEYYAAVKILGLASCNRKDPRPVAHAFGRMTPTDQEGLKRECERNGLSITPDGRVIASEDSPSP
jgi:hypothetical protein